MKQPGVPMSDLARAFLDSMLIENPVVMTFVGALLAAVLPRSARSSYTPALRYALALFLAGMVGGAIAAALPSVAAPAVYIVVGLLGVGSLLAVGELRGEWLGMPQAVLATAPLVGVQMLASTYGDFDLVVAAAGGSAIGFAVMLVLVGAIREASRISETTDTFKTNPVVLFSLAVFAIVFAGFLFW